MQHMIPPQTWQWAKQLGLGVVLYRLFYTPKRFLQDCADEGVIALAQTRWGQWQMEQAVTQLEPMSVSASATPLDIYFLTGARFWYQTCFCMYSLMQQTSLPLRPVLHDDGTLRSCHIEVIRHIFPNVTIMPIADINDRLDQVLPAQQFPTLRSRRLDYLHLRKLTDIHSGSQGWKLVLDSDMLFFHPPTGLLEWLQSPQQPCHMVDTTTAYGYSAALMQELAQAPIPERINVGICGLNSSAIDWQELEYWCKTLIEREGTHYYQEQALIAMLMARQPCTVAPHQAYVVMPDCQEVLHPQATLHHYVSASKSWYFRHAWKHIVSNSIEYSKIL